MGRDDWFSWIKGNRILLLFLIGGVISPTSVIANNIFVNFAVGALFQLEFPPSSSLSLVSDVDEPWRY